MVKLIDSIAHNDTRLLQADCRTRTCLEMGLFETPTPSQPRSCPANETVRSTCPPLVKDASYLLFYFFYCNPYAVLSIFTTFFVVKSTVAVR